MRQDPVLRLPCNVGRYLRIDGREGVIAVDAHFTEDEKTGERRVPVLNIGPEGFTVELPEIWAARVVDEDDFSNIGYVAYEEKGLIENAQ